VRTRSTGEGGSRSGWKRPEPPGKVKKYTVKGRGEKLYRRDTVGSEWKRREPPEKQKRKG